MKRHISLLIKNSNIDEINEIKAFCKINNIEFVYRYERKDTYTYVSHVSGEVAPLFYFYIIGDTNDYEQLQKKINNKLILTNYADICNIADLDDEFEQNLDNCLSCLKNANDIEVHANRTLLDFLMPIKDVKVLECLLNHYSAGMNFYQKRMIQDRIDVILGKQYKFEEEMKEAIKSIDCNVKELRIKSGMTRKVFSNYFGIPYRTIEDWENKKSNCSSYLFRLMEEKLKNDGYLI